VCGKERLDLRVYTKITIQNMSKKIIRYKLDASEIEGAAAHGASQE